MYLDWTRIDPNGPGLHEPKREGDVGWDLEAAEDALLDSGEAMDIAVNIRIKLPYDCWGEIRARSSIARRGLIVEAGIIDTGYTGPLFVMLRNMNKLGQNNHGDWLARVRIQAGERIGQLVLHHAYRAWSREVPDIPHDERRGSLGFGSTGR